MIEHVLGKSEKPLICTPLVGVNEQTILVELESILEKKPDLIEWRVDFFEQIDQSDEVIEMAKTIKKCCGNIPLLFTIRSEREGGQALSLTEKAIVQLLIAVCQSKTVDYIDYELSHPQEAIQQLRNVSRENAVKMIMSFHDFKRTPEKSKLKWLINEAVNFRADVAKVAVMPNDLEDILTLLSVTLDAKKSIDIPVITMSMGGYGSLTRLFGGVFGSAVTFAVGKNSSAPGQVGIEDLRSVLDVLERSIKGAE